MTHTLKAHGKMIDLEFTALTKEAFDELTTNGIRSPLYKSIVDETTVLKQHYGFNIRKGKPVLEMSLDGTSLELDARLDTDYEITYLPVDGHTNEKEGVEEFYFVTESELLNQSR